ncbi:hypothetical protein ACHWQZ_G004056 [Mnemiopsis leidyi]
MKTSLCLLLLYLNVGVMGRSADYRLGSEKPLMYKSNYNSNRNSNYNSWSDLKDSSMCFKRGLSFQDKSSDDEIEEEMAAMSMQSSWNGRKVVYKIDNLPSCTDIEDARTIRRIIDEVAAAWSSVEGANVMLVNIDDVENENGSEKEDDNDSDEEDGEYNNDTEEEFDNGTEDEFSNDSEELDELTVEGDTNDSEQDFPGDYDGVDIIVSFEPCTHLKHRNRKPNSFMEDYGMDCEGVYGHAHFFGDIHLNDQMTWTDRVLSDDEIKVNDFIRPNLYSIVLHEFGHSLGLRHTITEAEQEDVMYWDFSGRRKHDRLEISENDISNLQALYPVRDTCRDEVGFCSRNKNEYCNSVDHRSSCAKTCGLCVSGTEDDYMKCTESICEKSGHPMRSFCQKTCRRFGPDNLKGECTGLPRNISRLVTQETFPVLPGTPVRVSCKTGYRLDGNDVIYCVKGREFSWEEEEPECEPIQSNTECKDVREKNCKKLKKKPEKLERKCQKSLWRQSCPLTCGRCNT